MAYGKVKLGRKDREYIEAVFSKHQDSLRLKLAAATADPERAFYQGAIVSYDEILAKLAGKQGKVPFSEEELKTLRGALFGWERRDVAAAYGAALKSQDADVAKELAVRLGHLEELDTILSRPLILDRSQDAEDEEDEEENDEDSGDAEGAEGH
jgi:hypothetical protein